MTECPDAVLGKNYLGVPVILLQGGVRRGRMVFFLSDSPVPVMIRNCGLLPTGKITLTWGYEERGS